jgi:AI-2 transport protein TqsA
MEIARSDSRIRTICLLILTIIITAAAAHWLQPVLVPFVLALFLAIGLTPLVGLQAKYLRFPRPVAALLTLILAFVVLALIGLLVSVSVAELTDKENVEYQKHLSQLLNKAVVALPLERLGIDEVAARDPLANIPVETVREALMKTANAIIGLVSDGAMVLVFICFLLFGGSALERRATGAWGEAVSRTRRYIGVSFLMAVATGVPVGLVLYLLGVELALVFGLFAFLLSFVPVLGAVIATLLPLPMVLVSPEISATNAVLAIAIPALIQAAVANVMYPKVVGKSFDLHPIAIMMALTFWGMLWGIIGAFLAVPMTVVTCILLQRHELTRPAANLLAGKVKLEEAG